MLIQAITAHSILRETTMIKKTIAGALTALTLVVAVSATNTEAKANPIELGAAIVGGALYAGATAVGAVTAPYYVGPHYYYGPHPIYWGNCGYVKRFDSYGYWVRTDRVCY